MPEVPDDEKKPHPRQQRRTVKRQFRVARAWLWWDLWIRDAVVVAAIGLSLWSTHITQSTLSTVKATQHAQAREGAERRDQNCLIFERSQDRAVTQLRRTYEYLADLTPKQLAEPLNTAVIAGLPAEVTDAQTSDAPPYCNAPGVGLPEPDPLLPQPPGNLPKPKPK